MNPLAPLNVRPRVPLTTNRRRLPSGVVLPSEVEIARALHAKGLPALSLKQFVSAAWDVIEPSTALQWNWHLDAVCDHLQALLLDHPGACKACGHLPLWDSEGVIVPRCEKCGGERAPCPQNLLINVPPGTMKSLIFSVFAPAWVWTFRPAWRSVFASGTPAVVTRDSLKCRSLIQSKWYQETFKPSWQISADQNEKQLFGNTAGGFRHAMGAGQTVVGVRADFLGVDDPNDSKEIHSKAHREAINERWWSNAFHNRIADPTKSKRAIIMQRLHEEDLAGYVLDREKGEWAHLSIPMEFEIDRPGDQPTWLGWRDPRTAEGQLLADRFTAKFLEGERKTLGSSGYAGQMQQRPAAAQGDRFKRHWWRFYTHTNIPTPRPKGADVTPARLIPVDRNQFDEIVGSWDCAFKDKDSSDWVVGIVVGRIGADKFILERFRERVGFSETKKAVAKQKADWPEIYEILIEDKANGTAVIEALSSEIAGIVEVEPKGGKEARAAAIEPQVEAGNVYLPEGAWWLDEWIDEFAAFPKGKHDDQVDALSQALSKMAEDGDVLNCRRLLGIV